MLGTSAEEVCKPTVAFEEEMRVTCPDKNLLDDLKEWKPSGAGHSKMGKCDCGEPGQPTKEKGNLLRRYQAQGFTDHLSGFTDHGPSIRTLVQSKN